MIADHGLGFKWFRMKDSGFVNYGYGVYGLVLADYGLGFGGWR